MEYPGWARLRCNDCQTYVIGGKGEITTDVNGEPIRSERPTPCDRTPCKSFIGKPRMPRWLVFVVQKYHRCRAMGALPKFGGMNDQDPVEMRIFSLIHQVEEERRNATRRRVAKDSPIGAMMMSLNVLAGGR